MRDLRSRLLSAHPVLVTLAVLIVLVEPAWGQEQPPPSKSCLQRYGDTAYAVFMCDATTGRPSDTHVLFAVRTGRTGRLALRAVWSGPGADLPPLIASLVETDQKENEGCEAYFHVAGVVAGEPQWNYVSDGMRDWWDSDGREHNRRFCYVTVPAEADYVFGWSEGVERVKFNYLVSVPQTSYTTGQATLFSGRRMTLGSLSGSSTTNRLDSRQGTRSEWSVAMAVFPVEDDGNGKIRLGSAGFVKNRTGRWVWSKPDRDVLEDCLKYLGRGAPVGLK